MPVAAAPQCLRLPSGRGEQAAATWSGGTPVALEVARGLCLSKGLANPWTNWCQLVNYPKMTPCLSPLGRALQEQLRLHKRSLALVTVDRQ